MHPKDADGMANSVDPDQTASSEAVWSWSALFAETYLSQYIEFVRYLKSLWQWMFYTQKREKQLLNVYLNFLKFYSKFKLNFELWIPISQTFSSL